MSHHIASHRITSQCRTAQHGAPQNSAGNHGIALAWHEHEHGVRPWHMSIGYKHEHQHGHVHEHSCAVQLKI